MTTGLVNTHIDRSIANLDSVSPIKVQCASEHERFCAMELRLTLNRSASSGNQTARSASQRLNFWAFGIPFAPTCDFIIKLSRDCYSVM